MTSLAELAPRGASYAACASACESLEQLARGRGRRGRRPPPRASSSVQRDRVELLERGPQRLEVPLLREALGGADDVALDDVVDHAADLLVQVGALEHLAALAVDDLALAVHHVVVLEDVLAGLEVLRLDLALRGGDRAGDPLVLDRHVVGDLQRR